MFDWLTHSEIWIALGTLTAHEVVLGVDNIIFISVLVGRLPQCGIFRCSRDDQPTNSSTHNTADQTAQPVFARQSGTFSPRTLI